MKRYGLFVGINSYNNGITRLNAAKNDAEDLCRAFKKKGFKTKLLSNKKVNFNNIQHEINKFKLEEGDIFVFYFAGHGCEIGEDHYLLPHGANITLLQAGQGLIPFPSLCTLTNKPGVRRLFILDCCRNDLREGGRGANVCPGTRDLALGRSEPIGDF